MVACTAPSPVSTATTLSCLSITGAMMDAVIRLLEWARRERDAATDHHDGMEGTNSVALLRWAGIDWSWSEHSGG